MQFIYAVKNDNNKYIGTIHIINIMIKRLLTNENLQRTTNLKNDYNLILQCSK